MTALSPIDLDWIDLKLSSAVYYINQDHRMNIRIRELQKERERHEASAAQQVLRSLSVSPSSPPTENKRMSITGIQSGAFQAKLAEMREKMAAKQAAALATIDGAVTAGGAKMDEAVAGVTAKVDKEIADALHEFAQTTNGGPA